MMEEGRIVPWEGKSCESACSIACSREGARRAGNYCNKRPRWLPTAVRRGKEHRRQEARREWLFPATACASPPVTCICL